MAIGMSRKYTYFDLSYDVAVIQWITLCHKNHITTQVKTFWRVHVTSLTMSASAVRILIEMFV